jgi:Arc/MetJ-type ribon-helix-helix transcriptional regulator
METTTVNISLSPQATAFVQQAIAAGKTADDVVNMAIAVFQDLQAQQLSWLQTEIIEKGEGSGTVATDIDLETEAGHHAFWADVDSLATQKLKAGSINHNSIALPLA